jgi:SAM-dependent methyltransferase
VTNLDSWFLTILESYENPPVFHNGERLPSFPPDQLQINTTGQAGYPTLREAHIFYQDCKSELEKAGMTLDNSCKILDFGVGWGRIARFFLEHVPQTNLTGIDVTEDFIKVCRETFDSARFLPCDPFPPTELDENSIDLVVGYSVFSHLSEAACRAWMDEFHRVLRPGGMVAVTTRGRPFFEYCKSLRNSEPQGYSRALAYMFEDIDEAMDQYDQGQFVHSNADGIAGGGAMDSSFYGESFIPEDYARRSYSDQFRFLSFLFDSSRQTHPILFFQKR